MISLQDKNQMERCFQLALKGRGLVSPNPLVGAVILKDGKIISEGWHAQFGKDHAEAMAIKNTAKSLKGATLYCNLEPCIHTNKHTPPCYPLIVESGIKRVVISNIDPNPFVAGESVKQMKERGIQVETGVLEEKGLELNRFFFKHIKERKPWITLKIAQSIDGKISKRADEQTWLTGTQAKKYVHSMRAEYDAVLVGSKTVNVDNPQLNVREVKGRNPLKIIISARLNLNKDLYIITHADKEPVWIFCDEKLIHSAGKKYNKYVRFIGCPVNEKHKIDLACVAGILYENNIGSVLVEGGQTVFSDFLQQGWYDELVILQAPLILGKGLPSVNLTSFKRLHLKYTEQLGNDICFNLRKKETKKV